MSSRRLFLAAASKALSSVEIDPGRSNQHELAAGRLRPMLLQHGLVRAEDELRKLDVMLHRLEDDAEPLSVADVLTVYDSRRHRPDRHPEWRLYYGSTTPGEEVLQGMEEGDLLAFLIDRDHDLHIVLASKGSQWARVIRRAFALDTTLQMELASDAELEASQDRSPMTLIADQLGIRPDTETDREWLLAQFEGEWPEELPSTLDMARLAHLRSPVEPEAADADELLTDWLETETRLFYVIEEIVGTERLDRCETFDERVTVVMSVLQSRRARRGYSFEHHLEGVFQMRGVPFEKQVETEPGSVSDFIIPDLAGYRLEHDPLPRAVHLGAKSTARERWKQVLSEAQRLDEKHLATLDAQLSGASLDAMSAAGVRVVMPETVGDLYGRDEILTVEDFIDKARTVSNRPS